MSGHVHGGGYLTSEGDHGNPVHQILADFQDLRSGGSGYLCVLTFRPEHDLIRVRAYSPTQDQQLDDGDHTFALPHEMPTPGYHDLIDAKGRQRD